jgi:hypothetical protein
VFLVAGCGGSKPTKGKRVRRAAATHTATPTATAKPADDGQVTIRALVKSYFGALGSGDGAGACDTLAPSERKHFAQKFGSCAKAMEDTPGKTKGLRAGTVSIDGDAAKIEVVEETTGNATADALYAIREAGEWDIAREVAYRRVAD